MGAESYSTTSERINQIQARLDGITSGEWHNRPDHHQPTWSHICVDIGGVKDVVIADVQNRAMYQDAGQNGDFIAAAPADVRFLLTEIECLQTALDTARNAYDGLREAIEAEHGALLKAEHLLHGIAAAYQEYAQAEQRVKDLDMMDAPKNSERARMDAWKALFALKAACAALADDSAASDDTEAE